MRRIDPETAIFFANQLRSARLNALADAEAFEEIIHVIERLGSYLDGKLSHLGGYEGAISTLAENSWLGEPPKNLRSLLTPFSELYPLVRVARNDALHQGASARHLTQHAVELAIILEDALITLSKPKASDLMVRNPTCGHLWQPIGFIRQQMLANSYSYLPVFGEGGKWFVVSDCSVARFLGADREGSRKSQLAKSLFDAQGEDPKLLQHAIEISADATLGEALDQLEQQNLILVMNEVRKDPPAADDLLGILTAFDLL